MMVVKRREGGEVCGGGMAMPEIRKLVWAMETTATTTTTTTTRRMRGEKARGT